MLAERFGDGKILVAVADGMGGHAAGEVASSLALETIVEAVADGQSLDDAFVLANERVHVKAMEPGKQGMGTTMVAVLIEGDEFVVANVGDSRSYLLSDGGIRRLTEDHSFVAEAIKQGQSESEAMATPWKDALTRSIGTGPDVVVDVFGPFPVEENVALIVCSDGLYKSLADADLRNLYLQSGGPRGAAQSLALEAFGNGSDDNISVAIVEFGEVPREITVGTMPLEFEGSDEAGAGSGDAHAKEGLTEVAAHEGTASAADADHAMEHHHASSAADLTEGTVRAITAVVVVVLMLIAYVGRGGP